MKKLIEIPNFIYINKPINHRILFKNDEEYREYSEKRIKELENYKLLIEQQIIFFKK